MIRDGILQVFTHFRTVGGQGILTSNLLAVKDRYLGRFSIDEVIAEINEMEKEGLVSATQKAIGLTDQGEEFVYGKFDLQAGVREFMAIFLHFKTGRNQILPTGSLLAVKSKQLSPVSEKNLQAILNEAERLGYIKDGSSSSIVLTSDGFDFLS